MRTRSVAGLVLLIGCTESLPPSLPPPPAGAVVAGAGQGGNGQSGTVGELLPQPLRVEVTRNGHPVEGAIIVWSTSGSGASMSPSTSPTGVDGIASSTWVLPHHSGPKLAAAALSGNNAPAVEFMAYALPAEADRISQVSGTEQTGTVGELLGAALRVRAADRYDNAVEGAVVSWQVKGGDGVLTAVESVTDAAGYAAAGWRLGAAVGTQSVEARLAGVDVPPAEFTASATPIPAGQASVLVGNLFFQPATLTIASGTAVTWTLTATGAVPHSVRTTGFPASGIMLGEGQYFSYTFTEPGEYRYDCVVHGSAMSGVILVQ